MSICSKCSEKEMCNDEDEMKNDEEDSENERDDEWETELESLTSVYCEEPSLIGKIIEIVKKVI